MSLIFDALQRSETERSGVEKPAISTAADLLHVIERHTVSEQHLVTPGENTGLLALEAISKAVDLSKAGGPPTNRDIELLAQFPSLQITVPAQGLLPCFTDSESLIAEKFRFLGVKLRHLRRERSLQKVLITSTIPSEGKSMVAANLACALARKRQQTVLLLEGDVRRPSLSRLFGLNKMPGLCEWLQSDRTQAGNIYRLEGPDLWLLPAGSASANPLELLQSGRLSALLEQLSTLFDWVIIDSPPVLPLADTSVWSRLADGILLVARQGVTQKRRLQRGLEAIDQNKLIGALLNSSQNSAESEHYYYYCQPTDSEPENRD